MDLRIPARKWRIELETKTALHRGLGDLRSKHYPNMMLRAQVTYHVHWEIKGRFRKRVVLANVPSFRFSFRGNIRQNHPFGNHPFVNTKKAHWEIKGRFPKGWFWRMYPRSGFRCGGTSAKTTLLETTLLRTPDTLRLLNALNSEDRGLKVRFSLAMIVFETFELILCQMLSSQGKNAHSNPYPHYLVRLATSRHVRAWNSGLRA